MTELTQTQRIQRAHVWLMNHPEYCLFSGVMLMGSVTVKPGVPTAYTDGLNVVYGEEFMAGLTEPELRFLILHENMHKAFRHLTIWRHLFEKNASVADAAADFVINLMIRDTDPQGTNVKMPKLGLIDEKFRGMDTQQVFNELLKGVEGGRDVGEPMDEHDWEKAKGRSREAEDKLAEEIDGALRQGKILAGRRGAKHARDFMSQLEPQVDWREVLRDFISALASGKDMSTWRKPARRWIAQGVYMPSTVSETMGRVVVAIDTSGSISGPVLGAMLAEIRAICGTVAPESVDLLYWDTAVLAHETYERDALDSLTTSTNPVGGGGTDIEPVPVYIRDKNLRPECVIILTDGYLYGGWGRWDWPVLVCCTTDVLAPVGKTVRIRV